MSTSKLIVTSWMLITSLLNWIELICLQVLSFYAPYNIGILEKYLRDSASS